MRLVRQSIYNGVKNAKEFAFSPKLSLTTKGDMIKIVL